MAKKKVKRTEKPKSEPDEPIGTPEPPEEPEEESVVKVGMRKVRAIGRGFFAGQRRRLGDVFEVPEGVESKWFQDVGKPLPVEKKPEFLRGQAETATVTKEYAGIPAGKFADGQAPQHPLGEGILGGGEFGGN